MRTKSDRIRQAVSFELLGLALVTPFGSWLYGFPLFDIGAISVISSLVATCWNYAFNFAFDHALKHWRGTTAKTMTLRALHATAFELGLLLILLPIFSWWLGLGYVESFVVQLSFALFYLVYTFVFTWCYDRVFPDPDGRVAA
ncbi:putative membrane protein [Limimaricola soesokkakensis]|uniref:Bacterial Transmembrane Pair family protein n=1 Tax=Limimaricola soesokkakensis TaxID=1343159 RepID=A0A1X6Z7U2_9RHOB|nr:PACE efflux transporter [Limimaricola soesokkakensis]PSK86671.1 putative membrane protein [Limimaricola soesokkakensis]SLN42698.1 Bacterial Transmembrane Pair family protein [Limimaricola soesokkakensis]